MPGHNTTHHNIHTPHYVNGSAVTSEDRFYGRFDDKVAMDNRFPATKQAEWLKKTENYLIGRCHELEPWLKWALSHQKKKITSAMVSDLERGSAMSNVDPTTISNRLWSYLNLALADTPEITQFNRVERLNGFDAWRTLVQPLKPRNDARRLELHGAVHAPGKASHLLAMKEKVAEWKEVVEEFERQR